MSRKNYLPAQVREDLIGLLRMIANTEDHPNWQLLEDNDANGSWMINWYGDLRMTRLFEHFGIRWP